VRSLPRLALAALAGLAVLVFLPLRSARADRPAATHVGLGGAAPSPPGHRVRVKGSARIEAQAGRAAGKLVLSGTVVDDAGQPIADARLTVGIARATSPGATARLRGASADACSDGAPRPVFEDGGLLSLPTDLLARFCTRLALPTDRYIVHLESLPTALVDGARLELAVDLALEPVTLRFEPERSLLSLDDETTSLEVAASTEDDGVTSAAVGIPLVLANEAGTPLGSAMTNASGRARFAVDSAHLGAPGPGELRVSFAGSSNAGPSTHGMQVERRTGVTLSSTDAVSGTLPAGSPEDGVVVRLRADPGCAARGCVGSPSGTVEARVGEAIVGAATLDRGEARLVLTLGMPASNEVALRLRYVPDAPWYQARGELALTLPVRAPNPWKKVPLALAGLAVIGWLVLARLPPGARIAHPSRSAGSPWLAPDAGDARVELVRAGPAARGWTGRVRDAHDGLAIGGARIAVERPGFQSVDLLAQAFANADGGFALPPLEVRLGDILLAEAPLHSALRRPMPVPGEIDVALILRKRALVDRLVVWARRRGKPFDARPEPTPGQVRSAAAADPSVARWADAVERAAYGGGAVDEPAQRAIDGVAPADPADPASSAPLHPPPRARPR
jgi:hypothetical protein